MGFMVGKLLGCGISNKAFDEFASTLVPEDADDGEAIPREAQQDWEAQNNTYLKHAGWKLEKSSL